MRQTTVFIVQRGTKFKLLRLYVDGHNAVDNMMHEYRSHPAQHGGVTWFSNSVDDRWEEMVGPTMFLELEDLKVKAPPKEFEVFMVEEKKYVDQWGFKRTEHAATVTQRLTVDPAPMHQFARDTAGNQYVRIEEKGANPKWWRTKDNTYWYQDYPGQLMENHLIGDLVDKYTSRTPRRPA